MFFGLTNSLATFQTMMNNIFSEPDYGRSGICTPEYHSNLQKDSRGNADRSPNQFQNDSRHISSIYGPEGCEFEQTKIEYLRLVISEGHVEMDLVNITGVAEWPTPTYKKELQCFL